MDSRKLIRLATIVIFGISSLEFASNPAAACNKAVGCTMDVLHENYEMMHSDKMTEAMRAGQDNVNAFRRLQEAEKSGAQKTNPVRR